MSSGYNDLRPLVCLFHLNDISFDAIAVIVGFRWNLFCGGKNRLRLAEIDKDISIFYTLNQPRQNIALAAWNSS